MNTLLDNTFQALDFHLSPLGYFKERVPRFVNVNDNRDLMIEPVDNGQVITDSEDEKMRKQNKHTDKKKTQLDNLRAPVLALVASSATLLLYCPGSPTCLLPLLACRKTPIALLSYFLPAPVPRSLAVLSPLLVLSSTPLHLASIALRIFKQALSIELLCCSTSLTKHFVCFRLSSHCSTKPTISGFLIEHLSTLVHLLAIMLEKRLTWALLNAVTLLQSS